MRRKGTLRVVDVSEMVELFLAYSMIGQLTILLQSSSA
jgi:hypothetical protein